MHTLNSINRIVFVAVIIAPSLVAGQNQRGDASVGATTIPVVRIPAGARAEPGTAPLQGSIDSLPLSARIEIIHKALSTTSLPVGQPGDPIRLSSTSPKVGKMSGLRVREGSFNSTPLGAQIFLGSIRGTLDLYFEPVAPGRPHLLECGCSGSGTQVRLSAISWQDGDDEKYVELSTFSFGAGAQRLLAVVVPSQPGVQLQLRMVKGLGFGVEFCELTPFK